VKYIEIEKEVAKPAIPDPLQSNQVIGRTLINMHSLFHTSLINKPKYLQQIKYNKSLTAASTTSFVVTFLILGIDFIDDQCNTNC